MFSIPLPSEKQDREANKNLSKSKRDLLNSVSDVVREAKTRTSLSNNDQFVRYLKECSAHEIERFRKKLNDYANKMEGYTANIEASIARKACDDLDNRDFNSSRIKRYRSLIDE